MSFNSKKERSSKKFNKEGATYGNAFKNPNAQSEGAPQSIGVLPLSALQLQHLVQELKEGRTPTLDIAVWPKKTKAGSPFLTYMATIPCKAPDLQDDREEKALDWSEFLSA